MAGKVLKDTSVTSKSFLSSLTEAQRAELQRNLGEVQKEAPATFVAKRDTYTPTNAKTGKKGKPVDVLVITNSKFAWKPSSYGLSKCKGILACYKDIKAFVEEMGGDEAENEE